MKKMKKQEKVKRYVYFDPARSKLVHLVHTVCEQDKLWNIKCSNDFTNLI